MPALDPGEHDAVRQMAAVERQDVRCLRGQGGPQDVAIARVRNNRQRRCVDLMQSGRVPKDGFQVEELSLEPNRCLVENRAEVGRAAGAAKRRPRRLAVDHLDEFANDAGRPENDWIAEERAGSVYASVVPMLVANTLWAWAIARRGVGRTVRYLFLIPVVTGAVAALFLGERFGLLKNVGALLVLGGTALVRGLGGASPRPSARPSPADRAAASPRQPAS